MAEVQLGQQRQSASTPLKFAKKNLILIYCYIITFKTDTEEL